MLFSTRVGEALKGEDAITCDSKENVQILAKAQSAIILCFGDKPLRDVSKETYAATMWNKLENLYD